MAKNSKNKAIKAKMTPTMRSKELGIKYRRPKGQANANPEYEEEFKKLKQWKND